MALVCLFSLFQFVGANSEMLSVCFHSEESREPSSLSSCVGSPQSSADASRASPVVFVSLVGFAGIFVPALSACGMVVQYTTESSLCAASLLYAGALHTYV